jgi:hypothetical protein
MFDIIPDFNGDSRNGSTCSNCGSPAKKGDIGVAQGEFIDFEGSYDVCQACIVQIAGEFGMIPESKYLQLIDKADKVDMEVEAAIKLLDNEKVLNSSLAMQLGRATERLDGATPASAKLLSSPSKD